jgi:putative membrane protein
VTSEPVETQPERTALAWQRTGLGVLAVAGLLGHAAIERDSAVALAVAGVVALLALGVLGGLAPVRYRRVRGQLSVGGDVTVHGFPAAVTGAVVLSALAAAVAILTPR